MKIIFLCLGFKNINHVEYKAINLDIIQALADAKGLTAVTVNDLVQAGFVSKGQLVKVLGNGQLTAKIDVEANGFSKSAEEAIKALGFDGKSIINPRQIEVVNEVFAPKQKDIDKALAVVAAIKEAQAKGSGVISLNGKMVDKPVVIRAEHTIELAIASGILREEDL